MPVLSPSRAPALEERRARKTLGVSTYWPKEVRKSPAGSSALHSTRGQPRMPRPLAGLTSPSAPRQTPCQAGRGLPETTLPPHGRLVGFSAKRANLRVRETMIRHHSGATARLPRVVDWVSRHKRSVGVTLAVDGWGSTTGGASGPPRKETSSEARPQRLHRPRRFWTKRRGQRRWRLLSETSMQQALSTAIPGSLHV